MARSIAAALLHKGQGSGRNQDNIYFLDSWVISRQRSGWERSTVSTEPLQFFAVAGGVGGDDIGDLAAETVLAVLDQQQRRQDRQDFVFTDFARDYVDAANSSVSRLLEPYHGQLAGTSLTALVLDKTAAYTLSIGSSQAFLLRAGQIYCLTRTDHDDEEYLPDQYRLARFLGVAAAEPVRAENMTRTALEAGDMFLLATAGVTDILPEEKLEELLSQPQPFAEKAGLLGNAVRQAGGRADLGLVILRVLDPAGHDEPEQERRKRPKRLADDSPAMRQSEVWQQELRQHRWLRPLLVFLVFLLLGALAGKLLLGILGWLIRLKFGG